MKLLLLVDFSFIVFSVTIAFQQTQTVILTAFWNSSSLLLSLLQLYCFILYFIIIHYTGAEDIKKHKWFTGFDFVELLERKKVAPLVPDVKSESDTSNFDPYPDSTEAPPAVADDQQSLFADF